MQYHDNIVERTHKGKVSLAGQKRTPGEKQDEFYGEPEEVRQLTETSGYCRNSGGRSNGYRIAYKENFRETEISTQESRKQVTYPCINQAWELWRSVIYPSAKPDSGG